MLGSDSVLSSVTKPRPAAVLESGSEVGWVKRALTFPLSLYYPPSSWRGRATVPAAEEMFKVACSSSSWSEAGGSCHLLCPAQPRTPLPRGLATHGGRQDEGLKPHINVQTSVPISVGLTIFKLPFILFQFQCHSIYQL